MGGGTRTLTRQRTNGQCIGAANNAQADLQKVETCNEEPCKICRDCVKVCRWGEWEHWESCTKCGGQRKRTRQMHSHDIHNDGRRLQEFPKEQLCQPGASEETGQCPRKCGDAFVCEWSAWHSVGSCSATCGTGTRKKVRTLQPRQLSDGEFASLQNVARLVEVNGMKNSPQTTVFVSFACGVFSFALFAGLWQRCGKAATAYTR